MQFRTFTARMLIGSSSFGRNDLEKAAQDPLAQAWLQQQLDSGEGTSKVTLTLELFQELLISVFLKLKGTSEACL